MKRVELEQGTPAWLAWRSSRWMASEAAIVMAAAPSWYTNRTWEELRIAKVGLAPEPSEYVQAMFQHGHDHEERARNWASQGTGYQFEPACIEGDRGKFAASLDGIAEGEWAWLEIKCVTPQARWHHTIQHDLELPEYIRWQLLGQWAALDQCELMRCYLAIWDEKNPEYSRIINIDIEELAHPFGQKTSLIDDLEATWRRFEGGLDPAWATWAERWKTGVALRETVQERIDEAARELLRIADGHEVQACGVRATTTTRKGTIDWQRMARIIWNPDHGNIDEIAENHRRKSTTTSFIKAIK